MMCYELMLHSKKVLQTRRSCRTKTPSKYFIPEVQETRQKRPGAVRRALRKPGQPDVNQGKVTSLLSQALVHK